MKLKEKIIRKINSVVQNSGMREETKLFSENSVLVIDISKRLSELVLESDASYSQKKQLNEKLRQILKELR